jgi:hypothetical protein
LQLSAIVLKTGHPGCRLQPAQVPRLVLHHPSRKWRPGTDKAHLTSDDILDLRQLIEAELPNVPTHASQSRVVTHLEDAALSLVLCLQSSLTRVN